MAIRKGRTVSETQSGRLAALQTFTSPSESLNRLDAFAKWLFATVATVGTLGAALSTTGLAEPKRLGRFVFAAAVLALGFSLAMAAYSLAPKWVSANPNSIDSMENAVARTFASRRGPLRWAAFAFAAALLLAGFTP